MRDVLPAESLGGRGILVPNGTGRAEAGDVKAHRFPEASDLSGAVEMILKADPSLRP